MSFLYIEELNDNFNSLCITMENFEKIFINKKYIDEILVQENDNYKDGTNPVFIVFNSSFKKETETIERLLRRRDIVYIDVLYDDYDYDYSFELMVPYDEDEYGFNKLQKLEVYPDKIMLTIGKHKGRNY